MNFYQRNKKDIKVLFWGTAIAAVSMILLMVCESNATIADRIFVPLASIMLVPLKLITNLVPFSVFEILIILSVPIVVFVVYRVVRKNEELSTAKFYGHIAVWLLLILSILLFLYMLLYGLPCRRTPVMEVMYDTQTDGDEDELYDMTIYFVKKANETYSDCSELSFEDTYGILKNAYISAQKKYDYIDGVGLFPSRAKKAIFSVPMSYLSTTGIFMPFTAESAVSTDNPAYVIPYTMAHEMSHSLLVSREDEANFFAFLVSLETQDQRVQYSAYFNVMIYSLNALYANSPKRSQEVWEYVSDDVYADIKYNNEYIEKYEGFTTKLGDSVNDFHLKASGQEGIESYSLVVNLLLKWYEGIR